MKFVILFLALLGLTLATITPEEQQQVCAVPRDFNGGCDGLTGNQLQNCLCGTQRRQNSCTAWHGCRWSGPNRNRPCRRGQKCCFFDQTCDQGKVQNLPTVQPTEMPSAMPTEPCFKPMGGCLAESNEAVCNSYNGCKYQNGVCQSFGCGGALEATMAPTTCPSPPPEGCEAATKLRNVCTNVYRGCCKWVGPRRITRRNRNKGYCWPDDGTVKPTCNNVNQMVDKTQPIMTWFDEIKSLCESVGNCRFNMNQGKCLPPVQQRGRRRRRGLDEVAQ